jgi:hypothetical protein
MFETFTIQKHLTYLNSVTLAMHWNKAYRTPATLADFDLLVWAGQICSSCLISLFSTEFTNSERAQLIEKGFNDLPIKTIVKSAELFESEYIHPFFYCPRLGKKVQATSTKEEQLIMKNFYLEMGFLYRKDDHFKDWALSTI